ncbi:MULTISPECIES: hypothetical protein [unclassified Bacillus (in: firmicutes)]|uniref:hypothetical protein n=1 Tax=unclassified Bacillus (in: firmicutes) TaxID=185979 RepID=UPI0008F30445|nr:MULTISPECIES: hypothetical protein [unclassified Bacillus (in: firmicutes)]SFK02592.1 hypothetical protein SAMN04488574_14418 [Bacillus sp. 71mf]SFS52225.1 hypothetical protein SAMN04488145_1011010 [Bacillus sp. 103mf]
MMKYSYKEFSPSLLAQIKEIEESLKEPIALLLKKYKSVFAEKNIDFGAGLEIEGENHFTPGYNSVVVIGITEEDDELLDLYMITIWKCERTWLGMPVSKNIPGCKITGELVEESVKEVLLELEEHIEEIWKED